MAGFNYAFSQGTGIQPYILKTIDTIVGEGNAGYLKVDNLGFLNLLQSQKNYGTLQLSRPGSGGQIQFMNAKYIQRLGIDAIQTSESCSQASLIPWIDTAIPIDIYAQVPLFIDDQLLQEYTTDVNNQINLGTPPTQFSRQLYTMIQAAANAIMTNLDNQLQNKLVFGTNPTTGSSAASTINIPLNTTNLPLKQGLNEIFSQAQIAEFAPGNLQIFGSGLFQRFMNNQPAKTFDQSGLSTKIQAMGVDFYFDQLSNTILGADQIAVVSPDAVQLVEYSRYTGNFAGYKGGNSEYGTLALPMAVDGKLIPVEFDFQLIRLDCPAQVAAVTDYYTGAPVVGNRGFQLILSKYCGLFQMPSNQFKSGDFLAGYNGALRYTITNS